MPLFPVSYFVWLRLARFNTWTAIHRFLSAADVCDLQQEPPHTGSGVVVRSRLPNCQYRTFLIIAFKYILTVIHNSTIARRSILQQCHLRSEVVVRPAVSTVAVQPQTSYCTSFPRLLCWKICSSRLIPAHGSCKSVISNVPEFFWTDPEYYLVVLFGASFTILFEAVVLVLTWIKTADIGAILRRKKIRTPITALLLRDGM
jgi:hypothetical protein